MTEFIQALNGLSKLREALIQDAIKARDRANAQVIALEALTQRPAAQTEREACSDCDGKGYTDSWTADGEYNPTHCESCDGGRKPAPEPDVARLVASIKDDAKHAAYMAEIDNTDSRDNYLHKLALSLDDLASRVHQQATPEPVGEPIGHVPGEWYEAKDRDDLEAFFRSRLPAIREAAHEHGYAIGLHGSMRRDLDLIAAPWREGASDKDVLAHAIAMAACGITRDGPYQWEQKPLGRVAASLPCCWPRWFSEAGAGHIDLSVVGLNRPAPGVPEGFALVPVEPTEAMLAAFIDASPIDGGTWAEATEEDRAEVMNAWKAPWSAMLAAAQAKGGAA